ncbi:MAG: ferritin-like domain-containing protein [Proteobacteria bacterium]|nr:ferritin-like domain-containing protein [Pseudomonadota bacterium]
MTSALVEAADRLSRSWTSSHVGLLRPGSEEHKREVCRMFRETFNPYKPSVIAWPELAPEELRRLTSLPIWDIAVHTEGRARMRFAAYAESVADDDVRDAIMLNAWEENRHKEVLSKLVEAYGIRLESEPAYEYPRDVEWFYVLTGFSECIDSFFAFGLFELARRSGFFPPELVETFEPVMQEECRHILLFANWLAWHRASLPWWRRLRFELRVAAIWMAIARERIGLTRGMDTRADETPTNSNFTVKGASALSPVEFGVRDLMQLCLEENDRRFAGYDPRLVRPTTVPMLIRLALFVSRPWAGKRARRQLQPAD